MNSSIWFHTMRLGQFIVHIKGAQVRLSVNQQVLQSMRTVFILANSADLNEMPLLVTFHPGLHCLQQYLFRSYQYTKG